ncbi:MAG: cell division protein FtsQ/DivIB [Nitratireductor sp.]
MQPVKAKQAKGSKRAGQNGAARADEGGIVLPRFLRWPVRHAARLLNGGFQISPRRIAALTLAVVLSGGAAGLYQGGQADEMLAGATAWAGFRIADVQIDGVSQISRIDVLTNIDLGAERSLFSFDVHKARDDLKLLAWASDVSVSKAYPDKVIVKVVERKPFAIWQNGQSLYLVERDGHEIVPYDDRFAGLPLIVGKGANSEAAALIASVDRHAEFAGKVKAYVRVADRRWNLTLDNGVSVLLPEAGAEQQLAELARMQREENVFSRAIEMIDMRFADRVIVRLTPEAAAQRKTIMDARIEQLKKLAKEANI